MIDSHGLYLLLAAATSVVVLILLIAVVKLNPFLSLLTVSLGLAVATGMRLETIVGSFETGTGNTLGHIAIIVGLGTMLGKMMAESGASERIAETLIQLFGERQVPWSMLCAALIVGLPVFLRWASFYSYQSRLPWPAARALPWSWSGCPCLPDFPWTTL